MGSAGSNDVTLFANAGGSFRRSGAVPAGLNPTEILALDLDRDGRVDLAIANHEASYVTILRGDGRGGFRPAAGSPLSVHSKPHPHTIDACDANGDGWLDLVIDDWGENALTLLLSDGRGGFRGPGSPIPVGRKPYRNLRLRDLDGDGHCDIATPSTAGVTILRGDGRGGFRAQPPIPAGPAPFSVQIADLNRDGKPDLAVHNYSGQITDPRDDALTFLLGDGRGGFRLGPRLATGPGAARRGRGGRGRGRVRRRRDRRFRRLGPDGRLRGSGWPLAFAYDSSSDRAPAGPRAPRRRQWRRPGRRRHRERGGSRRGRLPFEVRGP